MIAKYAPDGFAYYSVSAPTVFRELLLPIDEADWTDANKYQWEDIYELSELHGVSINQTAYQRG